MKFAFSIKVIQNQEFSIGSLVAKSSLQIVDVLSAYYKNLKKRARVCMFGYLSTG